MDTAGWNRTTSAAGLVLGLTTSAALSQTCPIQAHYRFENGTAGAPASGVGTIVDSVDGSADGTPVNGPVYRADVGAALVLSCDCQTNALSLELNPGQSVRVDSPFIFHDRYGDATLEFLVKPRQQTHHSLFWTRPDNDDRNRYNIAINSGGGFGFDYRAPSGVLHLTPSHLSLFSVPIDAWSHIAIVRDTQTSAPAHVYDFYVNGILVTSQTDLAPDLPTSQVWQISGRAGFLYSGWIDEIRFADRVLATDEFMIADSDGNGVPDGCDNCRADFDGDGFLTGLDFDLYVAAFESGDSSSDFDGDGFVTGLDFDAFVQAFEEGCE